jgi:hypothetical protein
MAGDAVKWVNLHPRAVLVGPLLRQAARGGVPERVRQGCCESAQPRLPAGSSCRRSPRLWRSPSPRPLLPIYPTIRSTPAVSCQAPERRNTTGQRRPTEGNLRNENDQRQPQRWSSQRWLHCLRAAARNRRDQLGGRRESPRPGEGAGAGAGPDRGPGSQWRRLWTAQGHQAEQSTR